MSNALDLPKVAASAVPIDPPRIDRGWSYLSTGAVAGVSIISAVVGDALLARAWPRSDFLLYNGVNRFLTLIVGVVSFQIGFGIVRECRDADAKSSLRVLANACLVCGSLWGIATLALLAAAPAIARFLNSEAFGRTDVLLLIAVWLLGHTLLHLVISWLRARHDVGGANQLALISRGAAVLIAALAMLTLAGSVPAYYGILGGLVFVGSLVPVAKRWNRSAFTFDRRICRNLLVYSSSRCVDSLLRQASLVVLTTILFALGRGETAGELGILQTLIRGMESLFQPLVLLVLADSFAQTEAEAARRDVQRLWTAVALFSLPATLGLLVAGEFLTTLWLGEGYRELGTAFRITSLAVLPTIGAVLLRGHLDSRWTISPLAWINAAGIALTAGAIIALHQCEAATLMNLSLSTTVIAWLQFAVQFALLRHSYGIRVFDASSATEICRRAMSLAARKRAG